MKRQKILLYNPKAVFYDMPLALLSIGSMLDAAHYEVVIIDGRTDDRPLQQVLQHADDALCLGITSLTGAPLRDALEVTRSVRARCPKLPIIWGGWHTSLFAEETLRDEPAVDISVQGQGETTFQELVACLESGADLAHVKGITYRDASGEIIKNPGRALEDMNFLQRVNYDLIDVERYFKLKKQRQLDYISSTGCRFRCTFCADPFVFSRKWTAVQPDRMGEELEYWYKKYRFTDINFQDETFFTKRQRITRIAEEFMERDIQSTWAGTMRADQGSRMSDEEFDLCKKAGLRRVLVGVESGSQQMMDWLVKDIKIEQVYETARRCAKRDINVIFPFIVGFPQETAQSVRDTLKVARELNSMHPGFTTPIFYFKPYPGSKITQDVVAQGYELPQTIEEWADFDYIGSSGPWVSDEKYQLIERFKFYNKLAGRRRQWALLPLQWMAQLRCRFNFFQIPLEKLLAERLLPQQQLS
ncbi:MAG: radical SAM protein [Bacteroidota bacterium]